jgi:hypothetical protein
MVVDERFMAIHEPLTVIHERFMVLQEQLMKRHEPLFDDRESSMKFHERFMVLGSKSALGRTRFTSFLDRSAEALRSAVLENGRSVMSQAKDGENAVSEALVYLTPEEVRRLPKPRAGFEQFVARLVALVNARPDAIRIKGFDAEATLAELRAYMELHAVVNDARLRLAKALDTRLLHGSNVWRTTLRIYRHALAAAQDDVNIEFAIAEFEAFMKIGSRKGRKAP